MQKNKRLLQAINNAKINPYKQLKFNHLTQNYLISK